MKDNNNNNSLSVVLSVFNGREYIKEQLESLVLQTLLPDEVLIIDDCSTDDSVSIILGFAKEHGDVNFVLERNSVNLGWKESFMRAVKLAKGDIVLFCDQDDIWPPDKIERQLDVLHQNPTTNVVGTKECVFYNGKAPKQNMKKNGPLHFYIPKANKSNYYIKTNGCTMMFKRDFLVSNLRYWDKNTAHDSFLWSIALLTDSMCVIQEKMLFRRIHLNNTSRKRQDKCEILSGISCSLVQNQLLLEFLETNGALTKDYEKKMKLLNANAVGYKYRIELLTEKKYYLFFPLLFKYYHLFYRRRQVIRDLLIAFRGV